MLREAEIKRRKNDGASSSSAESMSELESSDNLEISDDDYVIEDDGSDTSYEFE